MDEMVLYGGYASLVAFAFCLPLIVVSSTCKTSRHASDRARLSVAVGFFVICGVLTVCSGFARDCFYVDLAVAAATFVGFYCGYHFASRQMRKLLAEAKELGDFGADHFTELDSDQDGVVSAADLASPETKRRVTTLDLTVLGRLLNALDDIGHPSGYDIPGRAHYDLEATPKVASLKDFDSYYQRRVKQWGGWLKS